MRSFCCCSCKKEICPEIYGTCGYEFGEFDTNVKFNHTIEMLVNDWSQLDFCDYLILGHNACDYQMHADTIANWATIKIWLQSDSKHRLLYIAEYYGCETVETHIVQNNFFAYLGTTIRGKNDIANPAQTKILDCDCKCKWTGKYLARFLNKDDRKFYHACVSELTGGTPLAYTNEEPHICFATIDQVGQGVLMVVRDSNVLNGCKYDNCKVWDDFFTLPLGELI